MNGFDYGTFEQEFQVADAAVFAKTGIHLSDIQKIILKGAIQGYTYEEIAELEGYSDKYLKRDVGPRLWKILSESLEEKVSKTNFRTALQRKLESAQSFEFEKTSLTNICHDWGEAVNVSFFYGRTQELATLEQWIVEEKCHLVALLGIGGIGKTTLSVKLAQQIQGQFKYVVWKSLRNAPPVQDLLADLIYFLSNQQEIDLPDNINLRMLRLLEYLRSSRCLLILDNFDSLLLSGDSTGRYQEEYQGYAHLLEFIGETYHQSCLVITSREKPKELALKEGEKLLIRSMQVAGLNEEGGQQIIEAKGLSGLEDACGKLVRLYGGNPLYLKMACATIQDVFDRNISSFLEQEITVFNGIKDSLEKQFGRLSYLEQGIMYWIAIFREPVSLQELKENIVPGVQAPELAEALESLRRRSLIEQNVGRFTQEPVVMEYITARFIGKICEEIRAGAETVFMRKKSLLKSHALINAQAKDYTRDAQKRIILEPLIDRLIAIFGNKRSIEDQLSQVLSALQERSPLQSGYTSGNILNLLCQLQVDLNDYDFSNLSNLNVWQAYLQSVNLHGYNNWVTSLAFSHNDLILATGSNDSSVKLWDLSTGKCLKTLQGHTSRVQSIAFSPQSQTLASGSNDRTVKIWSVTTGLCVFTLQGHTAQVSSVAFHPQGKLLATGSHDQTVRIWDITTGECLKQMIHHGQVWTVAFSPDVAMSSGLAELATGSDDGVVKLWNINTGECIQTLQCHDSKAKSITFDFNGKSLYSSSDNGTLKLWDVEKGECLKSLQGITHWKCTGVLSPDGQTLASDSSDCTVKIWNVKTGECLRSLSGHSGWIWIVAFSKNGQTLASSSQDDTIKIWDLKTLKCLKTLKLCKTNESINITDVRGLTDAQKNTLKAMGDQCTSHIIGGHKPSSDRSWGATSPDGSGEAFAPEAERSAVG